MPVVSLCAPSILEFRTGLNIFFFHGCFSARGAMFLSRPAADFECPFLPVYEFQKPEKLSGEKVADTDGIWDAHHGSRPTKQNMWRV